MGRSDPLGYSEMLLSVEHPFCWWCGRDSWDSPRDWHGPFLIERAHIVSSPRVLDRRAVVLLCSGCHRVQHGERISGFDVERVSLGQMLWLKRTFDPEYYDEAFLARFHIGRLPIASRPSGGSATAFKLRKGDYPCRNH